MIVCGYDLQWFARLALISDNNDMFDFSQNDPEQ